MAPSLLSFPPRARLLFRDSLSVAPRSLVGDLGATRSFTDIPGLSQGPAARGVRTGGSSAPRTPGRRPRRRGPTRPSPSRPPGWTMSLRNPSRSVCHVVSWLISARRSKGDGRRRRRRRRSRRSRRASAKNPPRSPSGRRRTSTSTARGRFGRSRPSGPGRRSGSRRRRRTGRRRGPGRGWGWGWGRPCLGRPGRRPGGGGRRSRGLYRRPAGPPAYGRARGLIFNPRGARGRREDGGGGAWASGRGTRRRSHPGRARIGVSAAPVAGAVPAVETKATREGGRGGGGGGAEGAVHSGCAPVTLAANPVLSRP